MKKFEVLVALVVLFVNGGCVSHDRDEKLEAAMQKWNDPYSFYAFVREGDTLEREATDLSKKVREKDERAFNETEKQAYRTQSVTRLHRMSAGAEISSLPTYVAIDRKTVLIRITDFYTELFMKRWIFVEKMLHDFPELTLILDLRDCPGGRLDQLIELLSRFFPEGKALFMQEGVRFPQGVVEAVSSSTFGSNESWEKAKADQGKREMIYSLASKHGGIIRNRCVILASGSTWSSAEIFIAVMKYYKRATIIGEKTAGKLCAQLSYDYRTYPIVGQWTYEYLKVTIFHCLLPDGTNYQGKGVPPDIESDAWDALPGAIEYVKAIQKK